jgi:hypothetical protein
MDRFDVMGAEAHGGFLRQAVPIEGD